MTCTIYILTPINKKYLSFFQKLVDKSINIKYNKFRWLTTNLNSPIVQPVEHLTVNQGVVGSSPTRGAKILKLRIFVRSFLFVKNNI